MPNPYKLPSGAEINLDHVIMVGTVGGDPSHRIFNLSLTSGTVVPVQIKPIGETDKEKVKQYENGVRDALLDAWKGARNV